MSDLQIVQLVLYGQELIGLDKNGNVWKTTLTETGHKWEMLLSCDQANFKV